MVCYNNIHGQNSVGYKIWIYSARASYIIDAINNLGGISAVKCQELVFDRRIRHMGISHHTLTNLSEIQIQNQI